MASNEFYHETVIILIVPIELPENLIKFLAIIAGILCLVVIILVMIIYVFKNSDIYSLMTDFIFGPAIFIFGVFVLGVFIIIFLLFRVFWQNF